MKKQIIEQCQAVFPQWRGLGVDDFTFADPKGFSSFTMGVRCREPVSPPAVLYRRLAQKENAILSFEAEKAVFLLLSEHEIAAHCYHYSDDCRLEAFYEGRSLTRADLKHPATLKGIADALYQFHQLQPDVLPEGTFFELLHLKWGPLARRVLLEQREMFPANEQEMCEALTAIYSDETFGKVQRCLPDGPLTFSHNDTYHGNVMKLDSGQIKLLDFEFSCLNHKAFDFSNLFAETVTRHKLPDYPYFAIAPPEYTADDIGVLVDFYLDNETFDNDRDRRAQHLRLVHETQDLIMMSDYMYAMAALPLAVNPIQKIRFIPYAFQRFGRFLSAYKARFG